MCSTLLLYPRIINTHKHTFTHFIFFSPILEPPKSEITRENRLDAIKMLSTEQREKITVTLSSGAEEKKKKRKG
jgi:hypothetical protein